MDGKYLLAQDFLSSIKWRDLQPEPGMVRALDSADSKTPKTRHSQNQKRRWSEVFADWCAVMIADGIRKTELANMLHVFPDELGQKLEQVVCLGDSRKAVDVVVAAKLLMGLQVGFSLKGFNTPDGKSGSYDKNLRNRLNDMAMEMLHIHTYLPMAKMIGICFMPLESVSDKSSKFESTFSRTLELLGQQTGRPHCYEQLHKFDKSFVCLYSANEESTIARGVARFIEVSSRTEQVGLPIVSATLSLDEMLMNHCFLRPAHSNKRIVPVEHE